MKKILILICFCLALSGCSGTAEQNDTVLEMQKFQIQYLDVFDTVTELTVYAESENKANEYFDAVHEELLELHKLFDPYNTYDGINNLKTINDNTGGDFIKVKEPLFNAVLYGEEAYEKTGGTINIAMGATLELWHKYRDDALDNGIIAVPSSEELEATRPLNDISALVYNTADHSVKLTKKGVMLNLGAIAKGYASDRAIALLKEKGCDSALVNLGGNVACYRGSAKDSPWKIGVQNAVDPENITEIIKKDNGFLISSGDYQRYYEYEGKRYHHIIDPVTLMPADGKRGTTVICGDDVSCADGDLLSTALFILPREKADELAKKYNVEQVYYTDTDGNITTLFPTQQQ